MSLILLAAVGQFAPPIAVSPARPAAGDIIELDASALDPKAKFFAWTVTPRLADGRKTIAANGPRGYLCSVPGTYHVVLAVGDAASVRIIEQDVVVATGPSPTPNPGPSPPLPNPAPTPPGPGPGPNPNPAPGPAPPIPDGRFQLAAFVAAEVGRLPAEAKTRAPDLARAFRALSAAIVAGGLNAWQIPGETSKAFDAAVGPQKTAWANVSKNVQTKLRELQKTGKLTALADLAAAYDEIATGLESVK